MDMDIRISVSFSNLIIIDLRQPVICSYCTGVAQDQSSYRIGNCRILLYTPVFYFYIAVYDLFIIQNRRFHITYFFPLLAVKDICLCHICISSLDQYILHTILNLFYRNLIIPDLILKICCHPQSQQINHLFAVILFLRIKRFINGRCDLTYLELIHLSISFHYLKHIKASQPSSCKIMIPFHCIIVL